jgi:Secretion system C-terminal sorting domain/Bacterial Ig domain
LSIKNNHLSIKKTISHTTDGALKVPNLHIALSAPVSRPAPTPPATYAPVKIAPEDPPYSENSDPNTVPADHYKINICKQKIINLYSRAFLVLFNLISLTLMNMRKGFLFLDRYKPVILLAAILGLCTAAKAQDNPPTFIGGAEQSAAACENGTLSIDAILTISDLDAGQTETWSVVTLPVSGTLTGFSASATSTGATISPTGLIYTPTPGFVGTDSFSVQVSDGTLTAVTTVVVTVHPIYTLTSTTSPSPICDGNTFSYPPTSGGSGVSFTWHRPYTPGISNAAASGSNNPLEVLSNITYYDVPVTYTYTLSAAGCSNNENVTVVVHPTPRLSSASADTICSGSQFTYVPASATAGTSFTWSRAAVSGISPATASGSDTIRETLVSSSSALLNTVYSIGLSANGCSATRDLTVTVIPPSGAITINTTSPIDVCAGTMYQNFGTSTALPSGVYNWSAVNADIWAVGTGGQYALVNFPSSGSAMVMLSANISAGCVVNDTFHVTVGGATFTAADVIYYGYQFIYEDNTADTYQWGYDNMSTLDSTLISGATFQSYPDAFPDLVDNSYWVIVSKGGCEQKIYYNRPSLQTKNITAAAGMRLYPNPATDVLNISIANASTAVAMSITDVTGRELNTTTANNGSAQMDISGLVPGCYFVTCFKDGIKIANSRFIKN